ncbi:MAG: hypothetical protein WC809_01450 [Sinimarinibacterium sp.]|jgi:hypothetical protein
MSVQGTPLPAGTQVGEYVIQRLLDQDDYGFRYRAQHAVQGSVLLHELFAPEFMRRGANGIEVEALDAEDRVALRWWTRNYLERARQFAAVQHPALLPVLSAFEAHGTAWHASPSLAATGLQSLLARHVAFDEQRADRLLLDLLDALGALRDARLLHRALSPQQIWVGDDGGSVIGGFGSLRAPLRFHARTLHSVMPEPYAAPEEHRADATPTPAADLYAAAAIAYHAISGQPPPSAEQRAQGAALLPLAALATGRVRESTASAIESALALDPAARWPGVEHWRASLHTPPMPRQVASTSPAEARRPLWMLAGVPMLVAVGLGAWWVLRPAPPPEPLAAAPATDAVLAADSADSSRLVATSLAEAGGAAGLSEAVVRNFDAESGDGVASEPATGAVQASAPPTPAVQTVAVRPAVATPGPTAAAAPPPQARATVVAAAEPTARPVIATPLPRTVPPAAAARPGGVEVASLTSPIAEPIDPAALAKAEEERRRLEHAQQLALERSRCSRDGHVSVLFGGRDFTYGDIAKFEDVTRLADGRLQTPPMRTDDGRRFAFLIDSNGCVVRMLR